MNAVVFGGTGFLGRAVARQLRARGVAVKTVARKGGEADLQADVANAASLDALAVDAEVVINLAARVPTTVNTLSDHGPMSAVNAVGAANIAQWAVARGARRLVHGSTLVVASRPWPTPLTEAAPTSPTGPVAAYAASKLAGELVAGSIARAAACSFVSLRFSALYGPGMLWAGVVPAFIDAAVAGRRLSAGQGPHADFLHVEDAARAVVAATALPVEGVVNVAAGVETAIVELATLVLAACGRSSAEVDVTTAAEARALVDVTRLREELQCAHGFSLADGLAELVHARRQQP